MAEVTVKQLADVVGIPVEKLLTQMKDAGLDHADADQTVTDDEKQALLAHLKRSHGEATEQKKITLKRKSVSKLKVTGTQGGRSKTVNVEVRKKRTYVKRAAEAEAEQEQGEEKEQVSAQQQAQQQEEEKRKAVELEQLRLQEETKNAQEEAKKQKEEALAKAVHERRIAEQKNKEAQITKRRTTIPKKAAKAEAGKESAPKVAATKSKKTAEQVQSDDAGVVVDAQQEAKHQADEQKRKELEEKARQETLAQARKMAQELDKRGDDTASQEEQELELGSNIVKEAFEESLKTEDRSIKRGAVKRQARKLKKLKGAAEHGFELPVEPQIHVVNIGETIAVAELARQMKIKGTEVVKSLMKNGVMASLNQEIDQDTAVLIVEEMGHKYSLVNENALEDELVAGVQQKGDELPRAPVVTIMGHVDHGKTSLLDYIRRAKVADGEAGGITQHIGAYHVETEQGMITFLDTPGHAAFTAMRARGTQCTDIVVIVVAADDGLMPQTAEAIDHARAAEVPIIIAINKMDKESADPERVKTELSQKDIIPEDWGGDYQFVPVSAHTGQGIDALLEAILLQSELLELAAPAKGQAQGVVIESRLDKGRGSVCSLLVQSGELKVGDLMLAGQHYGRVRAMLDENGRPIEIAGPSIPVEILGLSGTPNSGDEFCVVEDERKARVVAEHRELRERKDRFSRQQAANLEALFSNMGDQEVAQVNVVIKGDVRGSVEAIIGSLNDLSTEEVKVAVVSSGVGGITETDVNLAMASNAVILGFNVRADNAAKKTAQDENIEIRYYSVIYELIEDVKAAMSGLLSPEFREEILGIAEVREVYRSSKFGAAAGCMVVEGTVHRSKPIRVLRDDVVVFEGELESLRRFKDDVGEVRSGTECGIAVKSYNDIKPGDKIEVFQVNEIARNL